MYDDMRRIEQMELEFVSRKHADVFYDLIATIWDDSVGEEGKPVSFLCPKDSLSKLIHDLLKRAMYRDEDDREQKYTNILRIALRDMTLDFSGIEVRITFPHFIVPVE